MRAKRSSFHHDELVKVPDNRKRLTHIEGGERVVLASGSPVWTAVFERDGIVIVRDDSRVDARFYRFPMVCLREHHEMME